MFSAYFFNENLKNRYNEFYERIVISKEEGLNKFENIKIKSFENIGLITSSKWIDINSDNKLDLIVSGEWMPIKVFVNIDGDFIDKTKDYGLDKSNGLWNDIEIVDIDSDGDFDIIAANFGENNSFFWKMVTCNFP